MDENQKRITDEELARIEAKPHLYRGRLGNELIAYLRAEREHANELIAEHAETALTAGAAVQDALERARKAEIFARQSQELQMAQAARLAEVEVELANLREERDMLAKANDANAAAREELQQELRDREQGDLEEALFADPTLEPSE